MNSIVCVGNGDGLYGEQWNISGDRRVSIVLRDLNPRPQAVLFNRLISSVFHKTLSKYTPKNSRLHFSFKIYSLKDISNFRCSNQKIITLNVLLDDMDDIHCITLLSLKSDSTHHFFRNACTKSGSLRFSQFSGC